MAAAGASVWEDLDTRLLENEEAVSRRSRFARLLLDRLSPSLIFNSGVERDDDAEEIFVFEDGFAGWELAFQFVKLQNSFPLL